MTTRIRMLIVAASCAALGLVAPSPASAGCVGPSLEVPGAELRFPTDRTVVLPRSAGPLLVTGVTFTDGTCNDTPRTSGCGAPETPAPAQPARGVELRLTQGDRTWELGTADAASSEQYYRVRWEVVLPADLRPGRATLTAGTADLVIEVPAG